MITNMFEDLLKFEAEYILWQREDSQVPEVILAIEAMLALGEG